MQSESLTIVPLLIGVVIGAAALVAGAVLARRSVGRAKSIVDALLAEARQDAENEKKRLLLAAQEKILGQEEESDGRERELHDRESRLDQRARDLDRSTTEMSRQRKVIERENQESEKLKNAARRADEEANALREEARETLERNAGLTAQEARAKLIAGMEEEARAEGSRLARKIEDESRQSADREAVNLMVQACQRVNIRDVLESTVSFIELPSDEMKGRIIGREGRNIRAMELATGIDLIVDDTPRSILISSFDPVRREVAKVAIDRLVEDGRIHPARIEEVVQKVREEIEEHIEENGNEAVYGLGISDLHPRLVRLVGKMRYHTSRGQNLLQHCLETAIIASHMALEIAAPVEVLQRAGLLHEIGHVADHISVHPTLAAAELCSKYGESDEVVRAIRSLHRDVEPRDVASVMLITANRVSENRPGARKENLAVFIERLKRLEQIACGFPGVDKAYAVKAGKEIRVILNAQSASDQNAYKLSKQIARAFERELSYPGQIKVIVVRETRAVRFAV